LLEEVKVSNRVFGRLVYWRKTKGKGLAALETRPFLSKFGFKQQTESDPLSFR